MLIYMIKCTPGNWFGLLKLTSEGPTWLPEFYFVGIWTPEMRYNMKIYFGIKTSFKLYIKYYSMHYNKYKLKKYFI